MRIVKEKDKKETTVMFFHQKNLTPEVESMLQEVNKLLGLKPGAKQIKVSYGLIPGSDREIAMITRSMLHIMIELAIQIDVPPQHVTEGQTIPSRVQIDSDEEKKKKSDSSSKFTAALKNRRTPSLLYSMKITGSGSTKETLNQNGHLRF
jgi:hypothetical protein